MFLLAGVRLEFDDFSGAELTRQQRSLRNCTAGPVNINDTGTSMSQPVLPFAHLLITGHLS